ncbi:MAG: sulfotransferase domain-containing protein [Bacteroidota bacterium]
MKPVIIIAGVPQSYTSIVSKFLLDNGAYQDKDDLMGEPGGVLNYERFESKSLEEYVKKRRAFKQGDLSGFFESLPEDKVIVLKLPFIIQFINELDQFTSREIKVVYAQRNPQDIILSSMNKVKKSNPNKKQKFDFIYYFERIVWYYNFVVDCKFPVFPLFTEKLLKQDQHTAEQLLSFCALKTSSIDFESIDSGKIQTKTPSYVSYRFANFIWKRLSRLFQVYRI